MPPLAPPHGLDPYAFLDLATAAWGRRRTPIGFRAVAQHEAVGQHHLRIRLATSHAFNLDLPESLFCF